jgi:hypothetical protein
VVLRSGRQVSVPAAERQGLKFQATEGNGDSQYEGVHHRTGREDL